MRQMRTRGGSEPRPARPAPTPSEEARAAALLRLQRAAGNAATAALLAKPVIQRDLDDEAALAAVGTLPAHVLSGGGGHALSSDAERREFLRAGKEWFGSYEATLEHFRGIEQTTAPGQPYMHRNAKERLEAAIATLSGPAPTTTVAFSFRNQFTAKTKYSSGSMHTIGYAIDYDAYNMVRVGSNATAELLRLAGGNGPANAQLGAYETRRPLLEKAGDATAAGEEPSPEANAMFDQIRSESQRLSESSQAFQASLGSARDEFLELRTRYFETRDPAEKATILAKIPALIKPWTEAISAEEQRVRDLAAAAGLDPAALPDKKTMPARIAAVQRAKTEATAALKAAKGVEPKENAAVWRKLAGWEKTLGLDGAGTFAERAGKVVAEAPLRVAVLTPLLGGHEILANLTTLRGRLADPHFLFGNPKPQKKPKRGQTPARPTTDRVVSDPSAAQLLESGYFSPKDPARGHEQFNAEFMVAMARHGFDLGMAWTGETTDSMHFELIRAQGT
ncbi:hypothetical protein [Fodinicola acaciae]|uniref:hypothetical protein n=1 Tax=Fodinicola acaciae TaxID=2681555 RepID=UPI0013D4815A|nr:hypothetical protein [Fodinicola acaciae]